MKKKATITVPSTSVVRETNEELARKATTRLRDARIEKVEAVHLQADAVRGVLDALVSLEFESRRKVLRWAADFYGINPAKLAL